jgi:hypothetical protein
VKRGEGVKRVASYAGGLLAAAVLLGICGALIYGWVLLAGWTRRASGWSDLATSLLVFGGPVLLWFGACIGRSVERMWVGGK